MKKIYAVADAFAAIFAEQEAREAAFLANLTPDMIKAYSMSEEAAYDDRPYQVVNGIAMYDISGPMQTKSTFFSKIFGGAAYDEIADTLAAISQDEEVTDCLFSMNTPGGSVHGISDLSDSWTRLNAMKPITVHTSGMLASAGVWLASNSSRIFASETADVGSIGVIMQHVSHEAALTKEGVKVTDIKSAPLKHIGSPAHDLTPEEETHLHAKVMEADGLFKKQLYTKRPQISSEAFTGATFSAGTSLNFGLIDGIKTYTQVFEQLSASADSQNNPSYTGEFGMKRKVTQAMADASITAGADPLSLEILSQADYDAHIASLEPTALETLQEALASATEEDKPAIQLEIDALATGENNEDAMDILRAEVTDLTAKLEASNETIAPLEARIVELGAELDAAKALNAEAPDIAPLRAIVQGQVDRYRIALGMSAMDMADFSLASVVNEHTALATQFEKHHKPGGHVPQNLDGKTETPVKTVTTGANAARVTATF